MKAVLFPVTAIAILALSCAKGQTTESSVKGEPLLAQPAAGDCREAFTKNFSVDSLTVALSIDDVEGLDGELTLEAAKNAVRAAAKQLGCDEATLRLSADKDDFGAPVNGCAEVVPGISFSKSCYVASEDSGPGYFMVHTTLPEGVTVSFSRWD